MRHPHLRFLVILFSFLTTLSTFSQDSTLKNLQKQVDSLTRIQKQDDSLTCFQKLDRCIFHSIYDYEDTCKTSLAMHFDNSNNYVVGATPLALMLYGRFSCNTYDENTGILMGISVAGTLAATLIIKEIVERPRPFNTLIGVIQRDKQTKDSFSFPSGHASSSFSVATMFTLRYPKYPQCYVPVFLWSLIVSWGRPYLGMHYPSDLFAGALLGAGMSALVYSQRKNIIEIKNSLYNESRADEGSINGGVVSLFAASFILSDLFNIYFLKHTRLSMGLIDSPNGDSRLNIKWNF
jgi:membrane-associated phospholipid phosphatase